MRRALAFVVTMLVTLVVAGCGASSGSRTGSATGAAPTGSATVTRVVDGDTIIVRLGGRSERVRLIGIDTPESVKPGTPVQCFGKESSDHTKQLLPGGTAVRLERDVDARDHFGRLLAYVYRSDNLFVNLALVRDGFAVPDTIPPNVAHTEEFVRAAADARTANRGLWSRCGDDVPRHPSVQVPSPP